MKKLLSFIFAVFLFVKASATDYYFSTAGNDMNNGTATTSPFKTITKFNSFFGTRVAGDRFLFKRGEIFVGALVISRSGASGSPMVIGAYGTGNAPVITGLADIVAWTNLGSNIWESTFAVSTLSYTNMVIVNEVNTRMGRSPNTGEYSYQSHTTATTTGTLTSSNLNSATINWTGAEVAFLTSTYFVGRDPITAHSGGTITYTRATDPVTHNTIDLTPQEDNQRMIIQNDPRTLDVQNEWYYNPSTKKLRMYSTAMPTGVKIPTIDVLATVESFNYITFDGIYFQGSNKSSIFMHNSQHITIQNCDFNYQGINGIFGTDGGNATAALINNNTFRNTNSNTMDFAPSYTNAVITNNLIRNTGMVFGMGNNNVYTNLHNSYSAIIAHGTGTLVEYNDIDSSGLTGIKFFGSNTQIKHNLVNHFCQVLHDGGGIYTWDLGTNEAHSGILVLENIVLNGALVTGSLKTDRGIYMDDRTNGVEVRGNSIANCEQGMMIHNNWNMVVRYNTIFNSRSTSWDLLVYNEDPLVTPGGSWSMHDITLKGNILVAKSTTEYAAYFGFFQKFQSLNFVSDSNYYCRPINDVNAGNAPIHTFINGAFADKTILTWRTTSGQDAHDAKSAFTISDVNDFLFVYNATKSPATTALSFNYTDVKGVDYNGTITLAPYTSAVLMKNGPITGGGVTPQKYIKINHTNVVQ